MHYQLLHSQYQRGTALWSDFDAELADFGEAQYEALKPLILGASINQLQQAVDSGELSFETLTGFYLYRIRETENDPAQYLNAVISLNPAALEQARERDGGHGENHDPIFGMPVLLKDNVGAAGMPTTAGAFRPGEQRSRQRLHCRAVDRARRDRSRQGQSQRMGVFLLRRLPVRMERDGRSDA